MYGICSNNMSILVVCVFIGIIGIDVLVYVYCIYV